MTSREYEHAEFDSMLRLKEEIFELIARDRPGDYTRVFKILDAIDGNIRRVGPDDVPFLRICGKRYDARNEYDIKSFSVIAREAARTRDLGELARCLW